MRSTIIIASLMVALNCLQPHVAQAADLELSIGSLKESYLLGEPVFIDLTLTNQTSGAVRVPSELGLEKQITSLLIARGDGPFRPYDPGIHIEPSRPPRPLSPSEALVHRQLLLYSHSTKDHAFPASGTYRIKCVYHRFGIEPDVHSKTIEVRVTQPARNDAEAHRLFRNKKVADLIMNLGEDAEAVKNLELLMTRHQGTIYADYAQFYLARRQTREFFTRKPNYERAAELYRDLIRRAPEFPLRTETRYGLGMALVKTGQHEEAKEALTLVSKEAKITAISERARRVLKKMEER